MIRKYKFLLLFTLLTCASCDFIDNIKALMCISCDLPDNMDDWHYRPALSKLELDGYPFSIYKFFAWSMYNDSQFIGYTMLDTNQTFTLNGMKKLDFDFLKELPTKDTLKIMKLVPARNRLKVKKEPVRITFNQRDGITIQTEFLEKYNGYSTTNSFTEWFTFSSLTENVDSIVFSGITRTSYGGKTKLQHDSDSMVLPKRNLYLKLDGGGDPKSIRAEILIEEQADLFVYKQGTKVIESTIKNGFVRIKRSFEFTPLDSTVSMALSGEGLFKEIQ